MVRPEYILSFSALGCFCGTECGSTIQGWKIFKNDTQSVAESLQYPAELLSESSVLGVLKIAECHKFNGRRLRTHDGILVRAVNSYPRCHERHIDLG